MLSTMAVAVSAETTQDSQNPNLATRVRKDQEYYIFKLSDNVSRNHVYYKTRFGIELAGDLYVAKNADLNKKYPAIIVGAPFGGVKEQGPGVYANQLAQRGFVVLTFDPSYHGYSGGKPRMIGSTATYIEDFSAGVDFLGTQSFVDREKIGVLGICGSGGFGLAAASMDLRIKAIATSVMYDIAGNMNSVPGPMRKQILEMAAQQRWSEFGKDNPSFRKSFPDNPTEAIPDNLDPISHEFYTFYGTKRGHHLNALGNVTAASMADLMTLPSANHFKEISPRSVLIVAGEVAHSRAFSETAYANCAEPKELYIVPGANHVDLYDRLDKIPFDKFESFFKSSLK